MKIQFIEDCWILKRETVCGFTGNTVVKSTFVKSEPFDVLSINKNKHKQCSDIHVWSDGHRDGKNLWLINVPNGMFKQLLD